MKIIFYLKHQEAKVSHFLDINLFAQLLHLSLQFHVPKMSRSETPSFLRLQNSELPMVFRVSGANQNVRKVLFTDLGTVNPLLSPPGGLFFSSTFEGGLI